MNAEFTIVVDSREQRPFDFGGWPVTSGSIPTGDYSIAGFEELAAIERKSLDDLCGCVTHDRNRFKKELHRLQSYKMPRCGY